MQRRRGVSELRVDVLWVLYGRLRNTSRLFHDAYAQYPTVMKKFFEIIAVRFIPADELIFSVGTLARECFVLSRGTARRLDAAKTPLQDGELVGVHESARGVWTESVQAVSDCEVIVLP